MVPWLRLVSGARLKIPKKLTSFFQEADRLLAEFNEETKRLRNRLSVTGDNSSLAVTSAQLPLSFNSISMK